MQQPILVLVVSTLMLCIHPVHSIQPVIMCDVPLHSTHFGIPRFLSFLIPCCLELCIFYVF